MPSVLHIVLCGEGVRQRLPRCAIAEDTIAGREIHSESITTQNFVCLRGSRCTDSTPIGRLHPLGIADVTEGHIMNKLTKATIAGAVGVALLLGGAGTFATWNATAPISGGTIVAGSLLVGTPAAGTWSVTHLTAGSGTVYGSSAATTLASYKASPGDKLTYTTTVPITVSGTNLVATLALAPGAIAASAPGSAANTALAGFLTLNTIVAMSGTGITGTAPSYVINGGPTGTNNAIVNATVTATITFSSGTASTENTSMLGSVDLSGMAISLVQNS